jgi:hypothetical protein
VVYFEASIRAILTAEISAHYPVQCVFANNEQI